MRLDEITHQLKIKFRDQEIVTPFSTPALIPEWEFNLDFLLENRHVLKTLIKLIVK